MRARIVEIQYEETQRDEYDVYYTENVQPKAEGARRPNKEKPRGRMEILVIIKLLCKDLFCFKRADRRESLKSRAQVSEDRRAG